MASSEMRTVIEREGLSLAIRRGRVRGIGRVILRPDDPGLIQGVSVASLSLFADDRGYFLELARLRQGLADHLGVAAETQVSGTLSYPGTIKALHFHTRQTDLWGPVAGMFQVCLYDLRVASSTFGLVNTFYVGHLRPWQLRIPPGVAHGYKVVGESPGVLVYVTDRFYDAEDEGRIAHNDEDINYDWDLQHK